MALSALALTLVRASATVPENATSCNGEECEASGLLQVQGSWWGGCAKENEDPHRRGRNGRCCRGLTNVQGQFYSEKCTYQCFECTGRNGNKDPYSQCGGKCSSQQCKVPCCEGTYEVKGYWNSGQCSYQCTCAGYGEDVNQYCAGGNPCGGSCRVPCCYPMFEVDGRCRNWGEAKAVASVRNKERFSKFAQKMSKAISR